jgi:CRISPR-associated protein Cas1
MIKRTIYITNPYQLSYRNNQLIVRSADAKLESFIPIEDIGILLIESREVTLSSYLLSELASANVAVCVCDETHHPIGLQLPLSSHNLHGERFRLQLSAGETLRKQLWSTIVNAKIRNQGQVLDYYGFESTALKERIRQLRSGDPGNEEGQAARHYWQTLMAEVPGFYRDRNGPPPNGLFNFGYTIIRTAVARSLVGSGLLPVAGIHHHNRYNAYPLADDLMEPFRPWVDRSVVAIVRQSGPDTPLDKDVKMSLASILTQDAAFEKSTSPLLIAIQQSAAQLARCFETGKVELSFPSL